MAADEARRTAPTDNDEDSSVVAPEQVATNVEGPRSAPTTTVERRFRYELVEEPPKGSQFLRNEFSADDFAALYRLPAGSAEWFPLRQVTQERTVTTTPWRDA